MFNREDVFVHQTGTRRRRVGGGQQKDRPHTHTPIIHVLYTYIYTCVCIFSCTLFPICFFSNCFFPSFFPNLFSNCFSQFFPQSFW